MPKGPIGVAGLFAALLLGKLRACLWMIGTLIGFIGHRLYGMIRNPRAAFMALTLFDALAAVLTWRKYRRERLRRAA